jgi:hypothetical protein
MTVITSLKTINWFAFFTADAVLRHWQFIFKLLYRYISDSKRYRSIPKTAHFQITSPFRQPTFSPRDCGKLSDSPKFVGHILQGTGWLVWGSNPGWGEIFHTCPDRPWGPPCLLSNMRNGSLSRGYSGRGVALTTHSISRRGQRKSIAIYLIPTEPSWTVLGWICLYIVKGCACYCISHSPFCCLKWLQ